MTAAVYIDVPVPLIVSDAGTVWLRELYLVDDYQPS